MRCSPSRGEGELTCSNSQKCSPAWSWACMSTALKAVIVSLFNRTGAMWQNFCVNLDSISAMCLIWRHGNKVYALTAAPSCTARYQNLIMQHKVLNSLIKSALTVAMHIATLLCGLYVRALKTDCLTSQLTTKSRCHLAYYEYSNC